MITALFVISIMLFAVLFSSPRFLIKHRHHFLSLAILLAIGTVAMLVSGCAVPTWLTDANQIIGMVGTSITAIGSFVAALTGNAALAAGLALVQAWIVKVEQGLTDVEALVAQYNTTPDASTLSKLEAALADVSQNLAIDFANTGLPSTILNTIAGIAALALSQLQAWGSLLPAAKATPGAKFTVIVPFDKKHYHAAVKALLSEPTGDTVIDAALAKVKY